MYFIAFILNVMWTRSTRFIEVPLLEDRQAKCEAFDLKTERRFPQEPVKNWLSSLILTR